MRIVMLAENTSAKPGIACEHGVSMFIETEKHRLMMDFGASGLFLENAAKLGVEPAEADLGILSHGHYDHGGGLEAFFGVNSKAPVYVQRRAFEPHWALNGDAPKRYIGLDERLCASERIIPVEGITVIDEEITLFDGVTGREYFSETNLSLLGEDFEPDSFEHEQNLVLTTPTGRLVLISGCAHNGAVNIMRRFVELFGRAPDNFIGGFHLSSPGDGMDTCSEMAAGVAESLKQYDTMYHSCHCTGLPAFGVLKNILGDKIEYFAAGEEIMLD